MKLKDYIKHLQHFVNTHDPSVLELEVVYSTDDEGNNYHKVYFEPSLHTFQDLDEYYLETVLNEDDSFNNEVPNAVVIN